VKKLTFQLGATLKTSSHGIAFLSPNGCASLWDPSSPPEFVAKQRQNASRFVTFCSFSIRVVLGCSIVLYVQINKVFGDMLFLLEPTYFTVVLEIYRHTKQTLSGEDVLLASIAELSH